MFVYFFIYYFIFLFFNYLFIYFPFKKIFPCSAHHGVRSGSPQSRGPHMLHIASIFARFANPVASVLFSGLLVVKLACISLLVIVYCTHFLSCYPLLCLYSFHGIVFFIFYLFLYFCLFISYCFIVPLF